MSRDPHVAELTQMVRAEAKAVRRRATVLVQLAARLDEAVAATDSPKEGTRNERHPEDRIEG